MKAVSLWNPWALLVALGAKTFETRSWATNYRGPLVIHAAKYFTDEEKMYCLRPHFRECLKQGGYNTLSSLPLGAALAVVDLVDCVPTSRIKDALSDRERAFGNYAPGRWAWKLTNVRMLAEPLPYRGAQGLWQWTYAGELKFKAVQA